MLYVYLMVKRLFDIVFSFLALVLLCPLFLAVAMCVACNGGKPVLYRQTRTGRGGTPFVLVKFRTMTDERDAAGHLLPDAQRLPPWGRRLRRYSLDELPQFYNVLKGDMSLVGPRPLLPKYLALYTPQQMRRHMMRPGLTGLTAVTGRNALGWDERFLYDLRYIDDWSLLLDLKILLRTVYTAFIQKNREGYELSDEFTGRTFGTCREKKD